MTIDPYTVKFVIGLCFIGVLTLLHLCRLLWIDSLTTPWHKVMLTYTVRVALLSMHKLILSLQFRDLLFLQHLVVLHVSLNHHVHFILMRVSLIGDLSLTVHSKHVHVWMISLYREDRRLSTRSAFSNVIPFVLVLLFEVIDLKMLQRRF